MKKYCIYIVLIAISAILSERVFAQTFPIPIINSGTQNQNIRSGASTSGTSIITSIAPNYRLVAQSQTTDNGTLWYQLDLPSPTEGSNVVGYSCGGGTGSCGLITDNTVDQIEVYGLQPGSGLYVRSSAGGNILTINGSDAKIWNGQRFATTGNTQNYNGYTWYEMYLPNNCSSTKGWSSGQYLKYYPATGGCTYVISPTNASYNSSGGTGSVSVATSNGCTWNAVSNDLWITVTVGSSGSGSGSVNYSVASNSSSNARNGSITIAGQTFAVQQEGLNCDYSISPSSASYTSSVSSGSIAVSTSGGCSWTASSSDSWITIKSSSNGSVNYSIGENGSTSSRTGSIIVAGKSFSITQAGANCTFSISPTSFSCGSSSISSFINVNTGNGCAWTAVSNNSWIAILSGSSGSGNGSVNYSVASNSSQNARNGSITVAGQTVIITQSGSSATSKPDLVISNRWANIYEVVPGASTEVSFIEKNIGNADAASTYTSFHLSKDTVFNSGLDSFLADIKMNQISFGDSVVRTKILKIPLSISLGQWYILLSANGTRNVEEGNTFNNTTYIKINISDSISSENDYPYRSDSNTECISGGCDGDPWGQCMHYCTSYVAWKVNQFYGKKSLSLPDTAYSLYNTMYGKGDPKKTGCNPLNEDRLSNACRWGILMKNHNIPVNDKPAVGAIAWWESMAPGTDQSTGYGHVAYVNKINSDGSILLTEYYGMGNSMNPAPKCGFHKRTIFLDQPDSKLNRKPTKFIHIEGGGKGSGTENVNRLNNTELIAVYPNPSTKELNIDIAVQEPEVIQIRIFNLLGVSLFSEPLLVSEGVNKHALFLSNLSSGIYLVEITSNKGGRSSKIFTKQ